MFKNTHKVFDNNHFNRHNINGFSSNISNKTTLRAGLYSSVLLLLIAAFLFLCPPVHDDNSFAMTGTSIASDTTLSISITNPTLSLDLTPTSTSGTFASSSAATIAVTTNNITGYTLGIKANSNSNTSTLLINTIEECENTPTSAKCSLPSLNTSVSETDYSAATSTDLNNTWGYLPSYYNSVTNEDYLPAPISTGDIINATTTPNAVDPTTSELIPDEYTLRLGARIDYTPYAGNYANTFIITAVGNPVPYSISYDSNLPAPVLDTPTAQLQGVPNAQAGQVGSGDTVAVILSTNIPTITDTTTGSYIGYAFAGWCTEPTEIIDDGTGKDYQKCPSTATIFQPGSNFGVDQTDHNTQMLYAIWTPATTITFDANAPAAEVTGTMPTQIIPAGKTEALSTNAYTRDGYYFMGWNTDPNAYKATYPNTADYTAVPDQSVDLTIYAIWTDCPPNSICYDDNSANSPITMGNQSVSSNTNIILWPMNYKYDTNNDGYNDYGFAGWSEDQNAASKLSNATPDDKPTIYGPNQSVNIGDLSSYGMKLYAIWLLPATDNLGNTLTFQTSNLLTTQLSNDANDTLANKPVNYITALKDQRDNQVYAIAKLADGNYWMMENLRLDNNATAPNWGDDNLSEGFGGDFIGLADPESDTFRTNSANSLYNTRNNNTMPRYNNSNTTSPATNMTRFNNSTNAYSFGNYYTWAAAIADTTIYDSDDSGDHSTVATSICPANWHLPYNDLNTNGSFAYLDSQLGGNGTNQGTPEASNRWRTFPNNFIYSGYYDNSSYERSLSGYYWSNASSNVVTANSFYLNHNSINPTDGGGKGFGFAIRCVINQ